MRVTDPVFLAAVVLLIASAAAGGASRLHEVRLGLVELAALPLLAFAVLRLFSKGVPEQHKLLLSVLAAVAALPLLQLIPLPPGLWSSLPGRAPLAEALNLAGITPAWSGLSLTPDKTWRSFLALIPPAAMLLGVLASRPDQHLTLLKFMLGVVVASILLGAAQIASGDRQFYLWATTDAGNFAGFLANRNHHATLCLMALPFVAVLGGRAVRRGGAGRLSVWLWALFGLSLVMALAIIRSRAGIILLAPVLLASLTAAWFAAGRAIPKTVMIGGMAILTAAMLGVILFGLDPLMDRFDTSGQREGRFENWPYVLEAANNYLPLGSGLGSFDAVFRSVEPLERLDSSFFNQSHNDYLESWLEAGWFAAAVLAGFLVWFARRAWTAWRSHSSSRHLQRASSIAILAVLAHSAADYPLRTVLIACVFALCVAVLETAGSLLQEENTADRPARRGRL